MMRRLFLATLIFAAPATAAPNLERLLSGSVVGKPAHCIRRQEIHGQTVVDRSTIIFERGRGRYYRNDVGPNCAALRPDRALITRDLAFGFCEGDLFEVFEPLSRINYGSCTFGAFVPYQRPAE